MGVSGGAGRPGVCAQKQDPLSFGAGSQTDSFVVLSHDSRVRSPVNPFRVTRPPPPAPALARGRTGLRKQPQAAWPCGRCPPRPGRCRNCPTAALPPPRQPPRSVPTAPRQSPPPGVKFREEAEFCLGICDWVRHVVTNGGGGSQDELAELSIGKARGRRAPLSRGEREGRGQTETRDPGRALRGRGRPGPEGRN